MVVIVVDLILIHNIAQSVYALKKKEELQQFLELQIAVIRAGLEMHIVMISTII